MCDEKSSARDAVPAAAGGRSPGGRAKAGLGLGAAGRPPRARRLHPGLLPTRRRLLQQCVRLP